MFVVMLEATVAFFTRQGRGLSVGDCFLSDLALSIGIYTCSFSVQHWYEEYLNCVCLRLGWLCVL